MNQTSYDVVIIGAGPSGLSAALLLKQSNVSCCLIESTTPGGSLLQEQSIKNYPGFLDISGVKLAKNMSQQVNNLGVDYVQATVKKISIEGNIKNIITDQGTLGTEFVIIATGRVPITLGLENEDKFLGQGLSYFSMRDGMNYKDKDIVVVGSNNNAVEDTLYLAILAKNITLVCNSDYLKAKENIQDHLKYLDNIKILYNTNVIGFKEKGGHLSGIETTSGEIKIDGCFVSLGFMPNTESFKELDILNDEGYVETNQNRETQVKGIYAIGDAREKKVYEITTAVSDATIAAVSIIRKLSL